MGLGVTAPPKKPWILTVLKTDGDFGKVTFIEC